MSSSTCPSACKRCYSNSINNCYECDIDYVLKGQTCTHVTNYYFKIPVTNSGSFVSLKVTGTGYDLTTTTAFTMTFWMKFFGVLSTSSTAQPIILQLNSNTFLAFDTTTKYLVFNQNNIAAFIDVNFSQYIGNWIPVTLANYNANSIYTYYPNMITLAVNRIDLAMQTGYTIPTSGIPITQVSLGYEVVALFSEFRFYSHFIQGAYGQIMSSSTTKAKNTLFNILLTGSSATNCISNSDLAAGTTTSLGTTCIGDYQDYLDTTAQCNNDLNYFDLALTSSTPPCAACNTACTTLCFYPAANQCTCDLTVGLYWLRRDTVTKQAYCDPITNVDFSSFKPVTIPNIKPSITQESTIEFWAYIYSYNTNNIQFSQIDVEWHYHNKVSLINNSNSLNVKCYSLDDITSPARYTENINLVMTYYKWNLIRCGTNLLKKQFFFNSVINSMQTTDIPTMPPTVSIKIGMPTTSITNFGFVFIRQLKLWQQFNYKYIDTSYM